MNCPRCDRPGLRDHDAWYCLAHGTYAEDPVRRSWDLVDSTRGGEVDSPRWTLEELALWGRWKRGEPVPENLRHYACEICGRRYTNHSNLSRHKREQHREARQMALGVG